MMTPLSNTKRVCIIGAILLLIAILVYSNASSANTPTWLQDFKKGLFSKAEKALHEIINNEKSEKKQDIVKAYMYLGYAYLNQGLEEQAREYFENALKLNPNIQKPDFTNLVNNLLTTYVKQEETKLCPVFEEAKANVEMDLSLRPLDLFVAVDISGSIANPEIMQNIQELILYKLVSGQDRVVFFRFADDLLDKKDQILNGIPNLKDISKSQIVQVYKPKKWTNISKLFEKLKEKLAQQSRGNQKRHRAVVVISDGE